MNITMQTMKNSLLLDIGGFFVNDIRLSLLVYGSGPLDHPDVETHVLPDSVYIHGLTF